MKLTKVFGKIGLTLLAGSMLLGLAACGDGASNNGKSAEAKKLSPSQIMVMGDTYDIKNYTDFLKADSETLLEAQIMSDFNKNDVFCAPLISAYYNVDWFKEFEWSNVAIERRDTCKRFGYIPFRQREAGEVYGFLFRNYDEMLNENLPSYDFTFFSGANHKWTIRDYAKSKDYIRVVGQVAKAADYMKTDTNAMLAESGEAYIAVYLDGKPVDFADYEDELQAAYAEIAADPECYTKYSLYGSGTGLEGIAQYLRILSLNDAFYERYPGELGDKAKEVLKNEHLLYFAVANSFAKLSTKEASELVILSVEQEVSYEDMRKPVEERETNPGLGVFYYYFTNK